MSESTLIQETVGESIPGSTGNPSTNYAAAVALHFYGGNVMQGRDGSLGYQLGYEGRGPGWNRV